jgi:ribosome-binding factor A
VSRARRPEVLGVFPDSQSFPDTDHGSFFTFLSMSRRLDRVNELLRREIGNVIQKDYEWHNRLVTVSEVEVTQDLKEGKVWIGVLGGEAGSVIDKLNKDHGSIQSKIMKRVVLKSTPVLRFHHDSSAIRGVEIVNLLEEVDKLPKAPQEEPE